MYNLEREKAANIAATLYTVTNALGSLLGPNISGILFKRIGF